MKKLKLPPLFGQSEQYPQKATENLRKKYIKIKHFKSFHRAINYEILPFNFKQEENEITLKERGNQKEKSEIPFWRKKTDS